MARTLAQIRTDARLIIGQTDVNNSHFTNAQLDTWANEGYRFIVTELEDIPITQRSYNTASSITLNSALISLNTIKINMQPQGEWQELTVIDLDELAKMDADWENADAGKPKYAVRFGSFTIQLYPPPDTDNDGTTNGIKTFGLELPTELSDDSDTTVLPHNLDDIVSHWVAHRCFERLGNEQRMTTEITIFRSILKRHRKVSAQFSEQRGRWRWAKG